jgi:predicted RNA-binding protein with PUA-like domain
MAHMLGGRRTAFLGAGVILIGVAGVYTSRVKEERAQSILNYEVSHERPAGWKAIEHGPQTLFLYKDPVTHLLLRGAINQVVSEVNPTPELQTDSIAQYYIDRTAENQPEWTAKRLPDVDSNGVRFSMIEREKAGKCVVTAFVVKGNTTFMASVSGNNEETKAIEAELPHFREFLAKISLNRTFLPL